MRQSANAVRAVYMYAAMADIAALTGDTAYAEAAKRLWQPGDKVELLLPMRVRRTIAHEKVAEDQGKVALERGPLVYCAEWPDNKDGSVRNIVLPDDAELQAGYRKDLFGGVYVIAGKAYGLSRREPGSQVSQQEQELTAIPYYAWAHRGKGQMAVWLARTASGARPLLPPTIASTSAVSASNDGDAALIHDPYDPQDSCDESAGFFHWWPRVGSLEWVQYEFRKMEKVEAGKVYWFDDSGHGPCRVPQSWRVLYREGEVWKPVPNPIGYGLEKDTYNVATFDPVETDALRLEVQLQPGCSAGILRWHVE